MTTRLQQAATHAQALAAVAVALVAASGCSHHRVSQRVPLQSTAPAAPTSPAPAAEASIPSEGTRPTRIAPTPVPAGGVSDEDREFVAMNRPISSEEGFATWYTAPYKGRKAANGQVFSDFAMTAAHRTLPMGSLIVVTNLRTRQASSMRISDRGPFVPNKIIDLTIASAKSIGIYRSGTDRVRVDVYQTPKPMDVGGRWCVQIGPFLSEGRAIRFKGRLLNEYAGSKVIEFAGERSYWVRIRPPGDDREQAEDMARRLRPDEGV